MTDFDFSFFREDESKPRVQVRDWMKDYKFVQVTADILAEVIDACLASPTKRVAIDLETSGIDNRVFDGRTKDHIVGVCLSPDGKTGYYIPLRHKVGTEHNVPWSLFEREFRRLIAAIEAGLIVAIFHNGEFDQEFLEFWGGEPFGTWDKPSQWEDTLIEIYLDDSRRRNKRLKILVKEEFGIDQIELDELFPPDHPKHKLDFSLLDPSREDVTQYGGSDAIFTFLLDAKYRPRIVGKEANPDQRVVYAIEKATVAATRWMQRNRIKVSRAKVRELILLAQKEWYESVLEVYTAASEILGRDVMPGKYKYLFERIVLDDPDNLVVDQLEAAARPSQSTHPDPVMPVDGIGLDKQPKKFPPIYDVNAPAQLGVMFEEMQIPGLRLTDKSQEAFEKGETGKLQIKTSKDELERIIEDAGESYPFMKKIRRFRETSKAMSSYLIPMWEDIEPTDDTMRINFKAHKVDTGRFATPAKDDRDKNKRMIGWPSINLQSMPATYDPDRPACMTRLRECIIARDPGKVIVAIDYSGVELRLVTNLSREPKWVEEYFRCSSCARTFNRGDGNSTPEAPPPRCPNCGSDKIGDLHTLTALEVYGHDAGNRADWKQLRQNAKATNFALCYGGGGNAVCRATGCEKNEGWRIKRQFDGTYKGLQKWWGHQHVFGRKHGYVLTAFGRKYPVPDITSGDGGFRSKAERNAVNGPIQGSSADITKASMALVYKEVKKRGWMDKVLMIITMHDELVFEIDLDILEEAIEVLMHCMIRNQFILNMRWPIPLTSDVEIGFDWTVPWSLNEMRYREVRFKGNKKVKKPKDKAEVLAWEALPDSWPEILKPHFRYKDWNALQAAIKQGAFGIKPPEAGQDNPAPEPPPEASAPQPAPQPEPESTPLAAMGLPSLKAGAVFEYRIKVPLTLGTMNALAEAIHKCRGRGTKKLRLVASDGTVLDGVNEVLGEVLVSDQEFTIIANNALGL